MAVEAVTKAGGFTDEILTKNFIAISQEFGNVAQWQRHIEDHIGELYELARKANQAVQTAAKPTGMKTKHKILIGLAVGYYFGRKRVTKEFEAKLERLQEKATDTVRTVVHGQEKAPAETNFLGEPPSGS